MTKIKVTNQVVNRWGKRYIAKDWVIEVTIDDLVHFDWFSKVESKKIITKQKSNENSKKRS